MIYNTHPTPDVPVGAAFSMLEQVLLLLDEPDREHGIRVAQVYAVALVARGDGGVLGALDRFLSVLEIVVPVDGRAQIEAIRERLGDMERAGGLPAQDPFREFVDGERLLDDEGAP